MSALSEPWRGGGLRKKIAAAAALALLALVSGCSKDTDPTDDGDEATKAEKASRDVGAACFQSLLARNEISEEDLARVARDLGRSPAEALAEAPLEAFGEAALAVAACRRAH